MTRSFRRYGLPVFLAILITAISAGQLASPEETALAAPDANGPAWDALSAFNTAATPPAVPMPPRLLAGTNSHSLPANAANRNGYCLDVNVEGVTPDEAFGPMGFRVTAKDPIDPASPATANVPIPTGGTYIYGAVGPVAATDGANEEAGSTADDVYCVVVAAPVGYKNIEVAWHYSGVSSNPNPIVLPDIPIIAVRLVKIGDGIVGGPAEVCTVGWDGSFLTGAASNPLAGADSQLVLNAPGGAPDPVNVVAPGDFTILNAPAAPPTLTVEYVRQEGPEWCAGVGATGAVSGIDVRFNFHAVYNRVDRLGDLSITTDDIDKDADDQPVPVAPQLPPDKLVAITDVVELRHVTMDGNVPPRQVSGANVTGNLHYICLIGTVAADTLSANDIRFNVVGAPDSPAVSGINVFHKSPADEPRLSDTIDDGTLCFSYTSTSPGEHTVSAYFGDSGNGGALTAAFYDTDGNGNGIATGEAGPLITQWNRIDRTEITQGGTVGSNVVTFKTVNVPLQFNLRDGTFIGSAGLTEWVLGSHNSGGTTTGLLLDGAWIRMEIVGQCGYFSVKDTTPPSATPPRPKVVTGVSVGGRFEINGGGGNPFTPYLGDEDAKPDDIRISTLNAGGCSQATSSRLEIQVFYPNQATQAVDKETVDLTFSFQPANKSIRVAWVGQYVTLTYAISSTGGCANESVRFVRPSGQSGSFIDDSNAVLSGPDSVVKPFDAQCSASVRYESESPGEVDIEMFIEGNAFSKVSVPIYFLLFEDVTIEATPDQFVSSFGDVTAQVRGYFVGSNPSGRAAETKADGRAVPADRWVLPDDWSQLIGDSEFRDGPPDMPSAIVTFMMQNEPRKNSYRPSVTDGSSGFFIADDVTDYSFDKNPHTGARTTLGTLDKPRMMSQPSDGNGGASVDTFGDMNLTFEGCAANDITGNPHCTVEDIVGHGRYVAVVDYPVPENRGKFPAVASNVAVTDWRWAGYKEVSVVAGESPQIKYVVAHLRDRDGFCDAANYNNTLGVPVTFEIDAGEGVILDAADRPYSINNGRRFATATSFDTLDTLGNPLNVGIAKPVVRDDECQAWIRVSNSLMQPTNVTVTFPAPPSPVPGDVRITSMQCFGQETITVTNQGDRLVSLAGFGLQSIGTDVGNAEHLDLIGHLEPGESATFRGGPEAGDNGWLGANSRVLGGIADFMMLTWDDFVISTAFCSGAPTVNATIPPTLPLDAEGEIKVDVVIPFGTDTESRLVNGWNMVSSGEALQPVAEAFAGVEDKLGVVYGWDAELQEWQRYIPGAPDGVNTLTEIGGGRVYWVFVKEPFTLVLPK